MGSGFFSDTSVPYAEIPLSTLVAGAYRESGTTHKWRMLNLGNDDVEDAATRPYQGLLDGAAATWQDDNNKSWEVSDFGLLREIAKRVSKDSYAIKEISEEKSFRLDRLKVLAEAPTGDGEPDVEYPKGPFTTAAEAASIALAKIDPEYDATGPTAHPFPGTPGTEPSVNTANLVSLLLANTEVWGDNTVESLSDMIGQHSNASTLLGIVENALVWQTISTPATPFDWNLFAWSEPETSVSSSAITGASKPESEFASPTEWGTDISADTITDPSEVTVVNNINDAVSAFSSLNDLRFAQEETNLRASLFSTRQMMSSTFDGALAILLANKNAQVTEYDKSLRTKQAELQAQADLAHQSNLLQKRTTQAQLNMDAAKTNVDKFFKKHELLLHAAEVQMQGDVAYQNNKSSEGIANAQNALEANKAQVASGIQKQDLALKWVTSKYQTMTAAQTAANQANIERARLRADMLKLIYDTVMAWMQARAALITNAGSLASVIMGAEELKAKIFLASREHEMQWRRDAVQTATQYASSMEGLATVKWNALTQNLQMYRDAIATIGGVPGGTHKQSAFQNIASVASLGTGLISTGINLGMVLS